MDQHTSDAKGGEGVVRISGGTTPGAFPHLCPFQPKGATPEFCADTTSNLQRNKAGCFGTTDHRHFGPCNSKLRKCVTCLVRGEGKLNRPLVDLERGLCDVHRAEVKDLPPPPLPAPTRSIYFAPKFPRRVRPAWATLARLPKETPSPPAAPLKLAPTSEVLRPRIRRPAGTDSIETTPPVPKPVDVVDLAEESTPTKELPSHDLSSEQQIEGIAKNIPLLNRRELEVALAVIDQNYATAARSLGLSNNAVGPYVQSICSKLQIEGVRKSKYRDLLTALRAFMGGYKEQVSQQLLRAPVSPVRKAKREGLLSQEDELLRLFHGMTEGNRGIVLEMIRNLK